MGLVVLAIAVAACPADGPSKASAPPGAAPRVERHFARIAVVGASVSAGFGGVPLDAALRAAIKDATVTTTASVAMFRDAVASGAAQIDAALATKPDLIVAIDFLFWHVYNGYDRADKVRRLERGLADLDRARRAGAHVIVGDVPRIVTASELLIARESVPDVETMAEVNDRIRGWARSRADVLVVPFQSWAEPLAAGADVEVTPGEVRPARELMALDGLHPNPLGVWYVMQRIDRLVETAFAVRADDWQFARPPG